MAQKTHCGFVNIYLYLDEYVRLIQIQANLYKTTRVFNGIRAGSFKATRFVLRDIVTMFQL